MKTGKLSDRLRNAPQLLADEQYLEWVIEQVEELEKLEVFKIQKRKPLHYSPLDSHLHMSDHDLMKLPPRIAAKLMMEKLDLPIAAVNTGDI